MTGWSILLVIAFMLSSGHGQSPPQFSSNSLFQLPKSQQSGPASSSSSNSMNAGMNSDPRLLSSSKSSSSSGRWTARSQAFCTRQEKNLLFQNCAMSFGMAHMQYFDHLSRQRTCDVRVFDCGQVDDLMRCVNSQPVSKVSSRCWPRVDKELTGFLHRYRLPCSYNDLKTKCEQTARELIPAEQRQQHGQGINSNPMGFIRYIIMRHVMPMVMMSMMGGGGMGALFGA